MRVMIDTNVLLSALLFPGREMNALMEKATAEHQLVLSSYVVDGLMDVTRRKFKGKERAVDSLLSWRP
jgi:predicted nucleic acid-binding protein